MGKGSQTVLSELRRCGFAVVWLERSERSALEAARAASGAFFSGSGASQAKEACSHHGPARHPDHNSLVLHGLGFLTTPEYGGREQFHLVCGATSLCSWPSDEFREAFQLGADVLQRRCLEILEQLDLAAAEEWRSQIAERGDPSVCDAFLYPANGANNGCAPGSVAMSGHLDPGWFTTKQGCVCQGGGLQLWDPEAQAWLDAESSAFYEAAGQDSCRALAGGTEPEDFIVIFAGERLATWTDGGVPAVTHRVLTCSEDRLSFIYDCSVCSSRCCCSRAWTPLRRRPRMRCRSTPTTR